MKVKSKSEVTQLCLTLHDPMDCSLPDSSAHGIFQARVLDWGAISFSEIRASNINHAYLPGFEQYSQRNEHAEGLRQRVRSCSEMGL